MRRALALGLLAVLAGLGAAAVRLVGPPPPGGTGHEAAAAVANLPPARSVSWSCAGPLPLGPSVKSSIELANSGDRPVSAAVHFASTVGRGGSAAISVAPGSVAVVRPGRDARGELAARVVAEGSGLSVVELVHGRSGPVVAPCAAATAATEYLLAGDTRRTDLVDVALFDPYPTPEVASVSFATESGRTAPPTFQGVPVGAGQLVVLPVAERVPFQPELAVTVTSSGAGLAVGSYDTTNVSGAPLFALETAARQAAARWFFPTAPAGATSAQTIDLFDPGKEPAKVALGFLPEKGAGRFFVSVAPGGVSRVSLPGGVSPRTLGAPEVVSTNGVPIVAARELRIGGVIPAVALPERNPVLRARRAYGLVPRIPLAYSVTEGVASPHRDWVLGGGESDPQTATFVEVTDPLSTTARVVVQPIGTDPAWKTVVTLTPGASAVLDLADQPQATGRFAVSVEASAPVVADGALYAKGSVGFTSPAAIPD